MMIVDQSLGDHQALDLAREGVYRFLAGSLADPNGQRRAALMDGFSRSWLLDAAELLRDEVRDRPVEFGPGELPIENFRFEEVWARLDGLRDQLTSNYDRVFGLMACGDCPPYETEFISDSETFLRSQQMADIAGFYRAFGIECAAAFPERPDHLSLEMEFMALLLTKRRLALNSKSSREESDDRVNACDGAALGFYRDHLAWWMPAFARLLEAKDKNGFYGAIGNILAALNPIERTILGINPVRRRELPTIIESPDECSGCMCSAIEVPA